MAGIYRETWALPAYIELNNKSGYGKNYWCWVGTGGSPFKRSSYVPAYCRCTWTISGGGNKVAILGSDSSPYFTGERSWVSGSRLTSSGGSPYRSNDCKYFAEGYSNYPTWITSGFSDLTTDYTKTLYQYIYYNWGLFGNRNDFVGISCNSAWSTYVQGIPGGWNYRTVTDFARFDKGVQNPWFYDSERTSLAPNGWWATSSEGKNMYDRPSYRSETMFANCYTGHDVYLTFGNFSNSYPATFHIWVTTDSANQYSYDFSIYQSASLHLNDIVPGAQNCCIYVREANDRWPVAVEMSGYFN